MLGFGRTWARVVAPATLVVLAATAQGCVSLDKYEEMKRKNEAYEAAYKGADGAVGHWKKENDLLRARIAALEAERDAANQRAANAGTLLAAEKKSLQEKYEKLLEELRAQGGGEFVVNPASHGLVLEEGAFFASGKSDLKPERLAELDRVISRLNSAEFANAVIEVAGHTDTDPIKYSGWKDNYQLSAERARTVLAYFVAKGIQTERIFLSGYGPTRPRSEKKAENRRVEIVLHERG